MLSQYHVECCFTSTETVGLLGTGVQGDHLDFHTARELCIPSRECSSYIHRQTRYSRHRRIFVYNQVPGEIKRSRDLEEGGGAGPSVSPEEIMSREVELGWESWLLSNRVVPQQRCNGHCPRDTAQSRQLKQQLRSALVAGQWRGDTALTFSLF